MEERRVAASRVRLRDAEESPAAVAAAYAAAAPAASPPVAVVTGTAATGSRPAREATGSALREQGLGPEEGRRRSRKGKKKDKDKGKPTAGGGNGEDQRRRKAGNDGSMEGGGGGGGRNGWRQPASVPLAWASVGESKGTKGRQEEFRAPGELRDDFFGDSGSGSDSSDAAVSALTAYARLDPTAAATAVPRALAPPAAAAPAPAPTYAAGYSAPRRMEGFGGGSSGSAARSMGPGAPSPSTGVGGSAQQPMQPRYDCRVWSYLGWCIWQIMYGRFWRPRAMR